MYTRTVIYISKLEVWIGWKEYAKILLPLNVTLELSRAIIFYRHNRITLFTVNCYVGSLGGLFFS